MNEDRPHRGYRDESRKNYGSKDNPTIDCLTFGALARIADATELMAKRHTELIRERDEFERRLKNSRAAERLAEYRLRAAKGQITKLKKQLANSMPLGNWAANPEK